MAIVRLRRHTPGEYPIGRIDQSGQLHDAISTAFYFSRHSEKPQPYRDSQRAQAEAAAARIAFEKVVPFRFPRSAYFLAAAALLASGLTALRFRSGRLNLRAPLTSLVLEDQQPKSAKKDSPTRNLRNGSRMRSLCSRNWARGRIPISPCPAIRTSCRMP